MQVALYEPDIAQNTGTILRLCACLGIAAHIIEPAGFPVSDRAFRRAGMDYLDQVTLTRHASWAAFEQWRRARHLDLVLFTTRATTSYLDRRFTDDDVLLFGREVLRRAGRGPRGSRRAAHGPDAARACARSMSRWPAPWWSARRCGRRERAAKALTGSAATLRSEPLSARSIVWLLTVKPPERRLFSGAAPISGASRARNRNRHRGCRARRRRLPRPCSAAPAMRSR